MISIYLREVDGYAVGAGSALVQTVYNGEFETVTFTSYVTLTDDTEVEITVANDEGSEVYVSNYTLTAISGTEGTFNIGVCS